MPIINLHLSDPGDEVLTAATQVNIVEQLARAARFARGRGTVALVGAVVNDRGLADKPQLLASMRDMDRLWGGFKPWMGDGLAGLAANDHEDKGSLNGYEGNLYAQTRGGDAPLVVLCPVNAEIRDGTGAALLVEFTRAAGTGAYVLKAGTRIKVPAGSYYLATLEDVVWTAAAPNSAQSVRVRAVGGTAVALNTVTSILDDDDGGTVTVTTSAITVPETIDTAEMVVRYTAAFAALLTNAAGQLAEIVACDRFDSTNFNGLVSSHAASASAQGYFRIASVAPALGTTAATALTEVGALTFDTYADFVHPGVQRQFRTDSAHLSSAEGYVTTMPGHIAWAFRAAQERPEANPARPHAVLESMGIIGVEALATAPDRATHEAAGIIQPVMEQEYGGFGLSASFHAGVMADGATKYATRRMAFWLYRQILSLALPYHKALASRSNRDGLLATIAAFLERLKIGERIADYTDPQGDWDATLSHFTVSVAIEETGNLDVITLRPTFGPGAVADAA